MTISTISRSSHYSEDMPNRRNEPDDFLVNMDSFIEWEVNTYTPEQDGMAAELNGYAATMKDLFSDVVELND